MHGAGTDLEIKRSFDHAAVIRPEFLERQDERLERGGGHSARILAPTALTHDHTLRAPKLSSSRRICSAPADREAACGKDGRSALVGVRIGAPVVWINVALRRAGWERVHSGRTAAKVARRAVRTVIEGRLFDAVLRDRTGLGNRGRTDASLRGARDYGTGLND